MNKIISYAKSSLKGFIVMICYLLIISVFTYFQIISYNVLNILNYIIMLIIFFIMGYDVSSKEKKNGYLNGFLIGIIFVLLFTFICLILKSFSFSTLIYYCTLILSSITGGIIGVSKKINENH